MKIAIAVAVLLAAFGSAASAAPAASDNLAGYGRAMSNLSDEYTQCAAYFAVVSVAMELSDDMEVAEQYTESGEQALEYAHAFGGAAGILQEAVSSNMELLGSQMTDRIAGDIVNISILVADYGRPCKVAVEDPEGRMAYWLAEEGVELP